MMKKLYTLLIAILLSNFVSGQWVQQEAVYSFENNKQVNFVDENNGWIMGEFFGVFCTDNGGSDWSACNDIYSTTQCNGGSIFFTDVNNGWIRGFEGIWHTNDGELGCESNWEMQNEDLGGWYENPEPTPFFLDSSKGWVIRHMEICDIKWSEIYRTTDGGINWLKHQGGISYWLNDIMFVNNNKGWAIYPDFNVNVSGLLHSNDGGITWNSVNDFICGTSLYFINEMEGWITGSDTTKGIWYTADGGNTLLQQVGGIIPQLNDITFADELNGWAVGDEGTILQTSDGGQNWEYQESGTFADLHSVCFIDQNMGWICGDSGVILHTDNGGIVGIEQHFAAPQTLVIYPNPTQSSITIELATSPTSNAVLILSNTNGQQVFTQSITEQQIEIDINHLPSGIYIVKVRNDKDVMVQMVIKQ